jgi:hypothetical protein
VKNVYTELVQFADLKPIDFSYFFFSVSLAAVSAGTGELLRLIFSMQFQI